MIIGNPCLLKRPAAQPADALPGDALFHYDASIGGSLTTVSGKVSQWSDLSGHGHHLTQATDSKRPSLTGTINGIAVPTFSGGQLLDLPPAAFPSSAYHIFAVVRWSTMNNFQPLFQWADAGETAVGTLGLFPSSGTLAHWWANDQFTAGPVSAATDYRVELGWDGATRQTVVNGNTYSQTKTATRGGSVTRGKVGSRYAELSGWYLTGVVGLLLGYGRALTTSEISQARTHIQSTWRIAA